MKNNHPFLPINILDTYNQGWTSWIKAYLNLAHSKKTFVKTTPEELAHTFKILSDIPESLKQATKKNNMGE